MALNYVYRQGLIHRDVKPANLLTVINNGVITDIKVSDFGSALNLASDTTQIYRVGSLAYMSPEQLSGKKVDGRSDLFSLGVMLYQMVTGKLPFMGEYLEGVVAVANTGSADTGSGQWFVITGTQGVALPPKYSIIGTVTKGYDTTVKALENLADPTASKGEPLAEIVIQKVTITES